MSCSYIQILEAGEAVKNKGLYLHTVLEYGKCQSRTPASGWHVAKKVLCGITALWGAEREMGACKRGLWVREMKVDPTYNNPRP